MEGTEAEQELTRTFSIFIYIIIIVQLTNKNRTHRQREREKEKRIELSMAEGEGEGEGEKERSMKKRILLIINCIILSIGAAGGPLITRLYFIHGGNRVWLSTFLQTAGLPILLLPLSISYILRRRRSRSINSTAVDNTTKPKIVSMKPPLFVASIIIGVLTGLSNYLNSFGFSWLPVSTSTLIVATQLAFTAVSAFFLVKQKFTAYSVNAVVLLTIGAGVLALHGSGDRPAGESTKQYVMGFVMTLLAAALYGFVLPLVELVYKKTKQTITYSLVLEFQLLVSLFATLFSTLGMIITNSFKVIPTDAKQFGLGEANYYIVLVAIAIIWQFYFVGAIGVIFCASSLLSGIMIALLIPVTQVLAIIFYKEKFQVEKGVSLILSLWGFVSYFYGEFKQAKKVKEIASQI